MGKALLPFAAGEPEAQRQGEARPSSSSWQVTEAVCRALGPHCAFPLALRGWAGGEGSEAGPSGQREGGGHLGGTAGARWDSGTAGAEFSDMNEDHEGGRERAAPGDMP